MLPHCTQSTLPAFPAFRVKFGYFCEKEGSFVGAGHTLVQIRSLDGEALISECLADDDCSELAAVRI